MFKKILILPAALVAFACGGNDKKVDDALNSDLSTAAQAQPYTPLDSITAAERAGVATTPASNSLRSSTTTAPRTTVRRATTTRRSSSSGGTYSSAPVYSAPAPAPVVVKHTKRDAAIGAGAGAVIGAVAGHSVKGAIIGGAAGAILGGVIGNNVDKSKK
jgi:YMGG-like Gly-zipper